MRLQGVSTRQREPDADPHQGFRFPPRAAPEAFWRAAVHLKPGLHQTLIAVGGLLALLFHAPWLTLATLLFLASAYMPAGTTIRRLAMAAVALFGFNAAVLTSLALVEVPVRGTELAVIYLIVGAVGRPSCDHTSRRSFASQSDLWALLCAGLAFTLFYRPFVGVTLGQRLALLSYSTDAANHLSLVQRNLDHGRYWQATDYPQAWAGNVSVVVDLVVGNQPSATEFIAVAVPLIIGCYALLVYFAASLALDVVRAVTPRISFLTAAAVAGCICLSTLVGSTNLLLRSASYTQIVAITVLLAVGLLMRAPRTSDWRTPLTVTLISLALMQTWYLLAPVLAIQLLFYLATHRPRLRHVVPFAIPGILLALYPVLKGPEPIAQLNEPGGTPFPSGSATVGLLILVLVGGCLLARRTPADGDPRVLEVLVVSTGLLTSLIFMLQVLTGSGLNYYAGKALLALFLFGAVTGAAVVGLELERRHQASSRRASVAMVVLAAMVVGGYAVAAVSTRDISGSFATGRARTLAQAPILDAIFASHPQGLYPESEAWVVNGCARVEDRILNQWTHSLFLSSDLSWQEVNQRYVAGEPGDVSMLVDRASSDSLQRIEAYVHDGCDVAAVNELAATPKVTVIAVP